jgi:hypothetical protein
LATFRPVRFPKSPVSAVKCRIMLARPSVADGSSSRGQIAEVEVAAILGSDSVLDRRTIEKFGIYPKQYV